MSDKMLMENWRKFLAEEEALSEAYFQSRKPTKREKYKDRSTWQNILAGWRSEQKEEEAHSDELIKKLPKESHFWAEIFSYGDWESAGEAWEAGKDTFAADLTSMRGRFDQSVVQPPEEEQINEFYGALTQMGQQAAKKAYEESPPPANPEAVIQKYLENGTLEGSAEEWKKVVTFVLICHRTNLDENVREVLHNVTTIFGEGAELPADILKWGLVALGVGAFFLGGALPAFFAGLAYVAGAGGAILGPPGKWLNKYVEKQDAIDLSDDLKKKMKKDGEAPSIAAIRDKDTKKVLELRIANLRAVFAKTEFAVIVALAQNPHQLPSVDIAGKLEGEGAFAESKFHDNWRNFLLTEEKL